MLKKDFACMTVFHRFCRCCVLILLDQADDYILVLVNIEGSGFLKHIIEHIQER